MSVATETSIGCSDSQLAVAVNFQEGAPWLETLRIADDTSLLSVVHTQTNVYIRNLLCQMLDQLKSDAYDRQQNASLQPFIVCVPVTDRAAAVAAMHEWKPLCLKLDTLLQSS